MKTEKILTDIYKGFGKENVLVDTVDLLSMDGLDTYGTCDCKVHLGTFDDYRKARKNGMFRTENEKPFWLDTPNSTNEGYSSSYVQVVRGNGGVRYGGCDWCGLVGFVRFVLWNLQSVYLLNNVELWNNQEQLLLLRMLWKQIMILLQEEMSNENNKMYNMENRKWML